MSVFSLLDKLRYVPATKVNSFQVFVALCKHIKLLSLLVGSYSQAQRPASVDDTAILQNGLGTRKNQVYFLKIVAYLIIINQWDLGSSSSHTQFIVHPRSKIITKQLPLLKLTPFTYVYLQTALQNAC